MLTKEQASMICDAHEIFSLLSDEEEMELLKEHNPELLEAYFALHQVAVGADTVTTGANEASG